MNSSRSLYNRKIMHWLPAVAFGLLLAAVLLYGNTQIISAHKEAETKKNAALVGVLRENLPEISDVEIIRLMKRGEESEATQEVGASLLNRYGYDALYYSNQENRLLFRLIFFNTGIFFLAGCGCILLYMLHKRRVRKEVRQLQAYFRDLNSGIYDLDMENTSEGDLSLLSSDIFKVTQLLRTSEEVSRAKSEDLSRWLADISHQLKTPIASIRIMVDNLMDEPDMDPELRKEFLKDCSIQLEWISSLVQTLLKLARVEAGTVVLKQEDMDLLSVTREAVKKLGILSEISGVDIVWEDEPKGELIDVSSLQPIHMTGDPAWQLEAISNIMKNCLEHSRPGEKVYLSLRDTAVFKELCIRDTGEGIPEEDLPHIFERFYRAKNARQESVGIGLSLAASIVRQGGGKVTVQSEQGVGSVFKLRYFV